MSSPRHASNCTVSLIGWLVAADANFASDNHVLKIHLQALAFLTSGSGCHRDVYFERIRSSVDLAWIASPHRVPKSGSVPDVVISTHKEIKMPRHLVENVLEWQYRRVFLRV